jgi:hypothetical protein
MSNKNTPRDQRRSFRCTVANSHPPCQLKIGSQTLSATLQDESAGGFSILVDQQPALKINETAELQTRTGQFEVCLVHVVQVSPPDDVPPAELAKRGPWFRLGLRRLSETSLPRPPRISLFAENLRVDLGQWSSGGVLAVVGLLAAIAVVAVPLALMGVNSQNGNDRSLKLPFSGAPRNLNLGSWGSHGSSAVGADSSHAVSTTGTTIDYAVEFQQALKNTVGKTPDVALLVKPYAVRELQLTGAQQEQIRQLTEATAQALRDLDAQLKGPKQQEVSQLRTQVIDEAYRTALTLLTKQQRAEWDRMIATP